MVLLMVVAQVAVCLALVAFLGWLTFGAVEEDRLLKIERSWQPRSPDECPKNTRRGGL